MSRRNGDALEEVDGCENPTGQQVQCKLGLLQGGRFGGIGAPFKVLHLPGLGGLQGLTACRACRNRLGPVCSWAVM